MSVMKRDEACVHGVSSSKKYRTVATLNDARVYATKHPSTENILCIYLLAMSFVDP